MKFCFIQNTETGRVLGKEYEQPYSYSEYTSGGGCWSTTWVDLKQAIDSDNDDVSLIIFESKKKALDYLQSSGYTIKKQLKIIVLEEK